MEICKDLVEYVDPICGDVKSHHVLYAADEENIVTFDTVNLYLSEKCTSSLCTSKRYINIFNRFYRWYFNYKEQSLKCFNVIWLTVEDLDIKTWQSQVATERMEKSKLKPSDKTIYEDARIVHEFYAWANKKEYPVRIKPESKEFIYDFKNRESELLAHLPRKKEKNTDRSNIKNQTYPYVQKGQIRILSNAQINILLSSYADPVYSMMYLFSLCTGLRPEGVIQLPYIGVQKNAHIIPWNQMKKNIKGERDFEFTVTEKGRKTRTIKINVKDWEAISMAYLPLCEKRRSLYKSKNETYPDQKYFWFKKNGDPITQVSDISHATTYAKKRGEIKFPCCFYDARHWYATMYILKHLNKKELFAEDGYNSAVDKYLANQLGHADICTTYKYYVDVARVYVYSNGGNIPKAAEVGAFLETLT